MDSRDSADQLSVCFRVDKKNKKNLQFVSELNQWLFFYYGTSCLDDSVSH